MATLFFVRDGKGTHKTSSGYNITIDKASELAAKYATKLFKVGPTINEGTASPFAPYRHIVIEVTEDELCKKFPDPGFYYIIGLKPAEAQNFFSIPNP